VSLREDVLELLRWFKRPEPPRPPIRDVKCFGGDLCTEALELPKDSHLNLLSLLPEHLRPAYDLALADRLIEEQRITAGDQEMILETFKLTPRVHARFEDGETSPLFEPDVLVHLTLKGKAALAAHSTPSPAVAGGQDGEQDRTGGVLALTDGGFTFRGVFQELTGYPLRILEVLVAARHYRATRVALREELGVDDTSADLPDNSVRDAFAALRKVLREVLKKAKVTPQPADPLPGKGKGRDLCYSLDPIFFQPITGAPG
jgi:hypothetical protein